MATSFFYDPTLSQLFSSRYLPKHKHAVASAATAASSKSPYAHLPTSFERLRCELNRKKSKFERNGLFATIKTEWDE
jgi:hypothetical protein